MTDFSSLQIPATYKIAERGALLWSRGQIVSEVSAGRLKPDALIQQDGTDAWMVTSTAFPEVAHLYAASAPSNQPRIAPLSKRAWAYLLDSGIIGIPVAALALGGTVIIAAMPNHGDLALLLYLAVLSTGGIAGVLYLILTPLTGLHATLGMYFMGLRLVEISGQRITLRISIIRVLTAMCISGFCGVGYIWAFFDKKGRTLHDILASTSVIDTRI